MVALFRLASEQLTKHFHYDWGLRSLRSVLKLASQMRQMQPELSEAVILIRSLHEINLSKLVFEDVPLFLGIIKVSGAIQSAKSFCDIQNVQCPLLRERIFFQVSIVRTMFIRIYVMPSNVFWKQKRIELFRIR